MTFTTAELNALSTKIATDGGWVALFTADPGSGGTISHEVTGGSYARQALSGSPTSGVIEVDVEFDGMPALSITHAAIVTASSAGSIVGVGPCAKTFDSGDTFHLTTTITVANAA